MEVAPRQVFLSCPGEELAEYVRAAAETAARRGWVPVVEPPRPPWNGGSVAGRRAQVRRCDALFALVAHNPGWVPGIAEGGDGERSLPWIEVDEARRAGLPVRAFVLEDDPFPWAPAGLFPRGTTGSPGRLGRFKEALRQGVCSSFSTPEEVAAQVALALDALEESSLRLAGGGDGRPPDARPWNGAPAARAWAAAAPRPLRAMVAYCREDAGLARELVARLQYLRFLGQVERWFDRPVHQGEDWDAPAAADVEAADLLLLVATPRLASSAYAFGREMHRALERHTLGDARVVPVRVEPFDVRGLPFAFLPGVPAGPRPVGAWPDRDAAWMQVVNEIRAVLAAWPGPPGDDGSNGAWGSGPGIRGAVPRRPHAAAEAGAHGAAGGGSLDLETLYQERDRRAREGGSLVDLDRQVRRARKHHRGGSQLQPGEFLSEGRLRLGAPIAQGRSATVMKAFDREESRVVAVKVLREPSTGATRARTRFYAALEATARLGHADLVRVIAPPRPDSGFHFAVLEHLEGGDLRREARLGRVRPEALPDLVRPVARALDHAHAQGVVHGRVRPGHVLLGAEGVARLAGLDPYAATEAALPRGAEASPYLAPELRVGGRAATPAADVYALALTAVFALRGRDEDLCGDPRAAAAEVPLPPPARRALARALDPDPAARLRRAGDLAEALDGSGGSARPVARARVLERSGIALVHVPGGEFDMGCEDGTSDERPVHRVRLAPFWMGRFAVTNAEFRRFLEARPGHPRPRYWDNPSLNGPDQPVVGVSWEDARAFCAWAGTLLPTEAQWEYACRAGTGTRWWCGDDEAALEEVAWYGRGARSHTHPVGRKRPNPFGLYDMHGNVWEWCQDWYGPYPDAPRVDPIGPERGEARVRRGGCSWNDAQGVRSAHRDWFDPGIRSVVVGFRVALPAGLEV